MGRSSRCLSRLAVSLFAFTCLAALSGCNGSRQQPPAGTPDTPSGASPVVPTLTDVARAERVRFAYAHGGSGQFFYAEIMGGGGALADFDGDGWLDVYCVQGAPLPGYRGQADFRNRMFRNRGAAAGTGPRFEDVTAQSGTDGYRAGKKLYGIGCATGDYDNDGDPDLLVTGFSGLLLYRNEGGMRFTEVAVAAGLHPTRYGVSAAFLDYDDDGLLDLAICEYVQYSLTGNKPCQDATGAPDYCQPDYFPPLQPRLYHNEGQGRFQDVTDSAGLTRPGRALGVVAGDVTGDGKQDLFVACDKTPNLLYVNQGNGRFTEEALTRGCAVGATGQTQSGMGVDLQDVDGDLQPELAVTNYWYEPNNLYRNLGNGDFSDVSASAGLSVPNLSQVSFGVGLPDLNNDGWPELLITNGHVITRTKSATPGAERSQLDQLYLNLGKGSFRDVSKEAGPWFTQRHVGRGSAFGDIDNDGDVDVLALTNEGPAALLRNETKGGGWVRFRLIGRRSNRDGIGATVDVTVGGRVQRRMVRTGYSYASAGDPRVHFGLGTAERAERVEVRWPSGAIERAESLAGGRDYVVTEGGGFR